jgi:hypothetical protein
LRSLQKENSGSEKIVATKKKSGGIEIYVMRIRWRKQKCLTHNSEMGTEQDAATGQATNNKNKTGIGVVFGIIEIVSGVLWQAADDFSNPTAYWIHFLSKCGFLAGAAYLAHEFTKGIIWRVCIWSAFLFLCGVLFIIKPIESTRPAFSIIALGMTVELNNPNGQLLSAEFCGCVSDGFFFKSEQIDCGTFLQCQNPRKI